MERMRWFSGVSDFCFAQVVEFMLLLSHPSQRQYELV